MGSSRGSLGEPVLNLGWVLSPTAGVITKEKREGLDTQTQRAWPPGKGHRGQ